MNKDQNFQEIVAKSCSKMFETNFITVCTFVENEHKRETNITPLLFTVRTYVENEHKRETDTSSTFLLK